MTKPLNICVCGWYFDKFDDWYMSLHRIKEKYPVFVVCNRESDYQNIFDLPHAVRENKGLEWGAYNHYLMHHWPGKEPVLFCHDDIVLNPVVVNGEILPPEFIFDKIAEADVDQAYIFGSRAEDVENYGQHGRMVLMSEAFLKKAKDMGGFWYDAKNKGYVTGKDSHLKEKYECLGYNAGIISFHSQAKAIGGNIHRKIFIPSFDLAKRGEPTQRQLTYGKWVGNIERIRKSSEVKLNLGSGDNPFEDSTNIDLFDDRADIKADVRELPFDPESCDWIESHHLIEHLKSDDLFLALKEWLRVLRTGGHIFLSCPDIAACFQSMIGNADSDDVWQGLMHAVYGEDKPGMKHQYGYCRKSLELLLTNAGFEDVEVMTAFGFRPTPSLLAFAKKPEMES